MAHDHSVGAEGECLGGLFGGGDPAFGDKRHAQTGREGGDELEVRAGRRRQALGVSSQGRRDEVCPGLLGDQPFLDGGDVGHDRQTCLATDPLDDVGKGQAIRPGAIRRIEGDDRCPGSRHRLGVFQLRCDPDAQAG